MLTAVAAVLLATGPLPAWTDPPDPPRADPSCTVERDLMAQVLLTRGFTAPAANTFACLTVADCRSITLISSGTLISPGT